MATRDTRALATAAVLLLAVAASFHALRAAAEARSVKLVVDYGDGVEKHFPAIPWKEGMTVLDVMSAATGRAHGIAFEHTGSGDTAILTRIDDLSNEGGGKEKKNWLYWVNDKFAERSFGAYELAPSDVVVWRFALWPESE